MNLQPDRFSSRVGILDHLLSEIVVALQLTDTQIARMESAYKTIGAWLEHPGSPLAIYRPLIYGQGSAAIGTTVRPWGRTEFDLDFVLEVAFFPGTPMELYELLLKRLGENGTYAKMIEPKRRCIRLNYEGDFHVDVLGSRSALRPIIAGSIEIPDRTTPTQWKDSNPRGYADWFIGRSRTAAEARLLARALPLPTDWAADAKTVLQRIVQLAKRHRDVVFGDNDSAPRSVVLTTLQATVYRGQLSLYEAMAESLDLLVAEIEKAKPSRLVVLNPMNPAEDFSEKWNEDPRSYSAFTGWATSYRDRFHALRYVQGLDALTNALAGLFGEDVSKHATHRYQKALAEARESNQLRAAGPIIISSATPRGSAIPPNHNYGSDY
jgi:hypothetical protein